MAYATYKLRRYYHYYRNRTITTNKRANGVTTSSFLLSLHVTCVAPSVAKNAYASIGMAKNM